MGELSPKQHKLIEQARAFARELSCHLQEEAGKIEQCLKAIDGTANVQRMVIASQL